MIDKTRVEDLVNASLEDGKLFLVEVRVGKDNTISVFIDGDEGVRIQDCIDLSRKVESGLDRETEDFELNVLSWGLGEPLKLRRQYIKNIGQRVEVVNGEDRKTEGRLMEVKENSFVLEVVKRNPRAKSLKDVSKKAQPKTEEIEFETVKTIKVII